MLKKTKYLLIFCLFFLIICLTNVSFGSYDVVYEGETISLPDLPFDTTAHPNYMVCRSTYFRSNGHWSVCYQIDNGKVFYSDPSTQGFAYYKTDTTTTGGWVYYDIICEDLSADSVWSVAHSGAKLLKIGTNGTILKSTFDIYTDTTYSTLYYDKSNSFFVTPYIANTDADLVTCDFDYITVVPGSINSNEDLNFVVRKKNWIPGIEVDGYYNLDIVYNTVLNSSSNYYNGTLLNTGELWVWYEIPINDLNIDFKNNETYIYSLEYVKDGENVYIDKEINTIFLTEEEKANNQILTGLDNLKTSLSADNEKLLEEERKTQEAINEQTNVNKNIFERIGEMLSYINPLSENFFAYKLIELFLEMLKSIFIPSENFFNDWLSELNTFFGDRFGILYYPLELLIDFFTRYNDYVLNGTFETAIFHIPELKIFGTTIINSFDYDLFTLLENETFKNVHNIYLILIDAIFSLLLVQLAANTMAEVIGGRFSDEVIGDVTRNERSYNNYVRYQNNKKRYKSERGGKK